MLNLRIAIIREDKSRPYSWREKLAALKTPLNPAARGISSNPSGPVTTTPVGTTGLWSSSRPANRNSRVTNVFKNAGPGTWSSLKVSHAPGNYFTIVDTSV